MSDAKTSYRQAPRPILMHTEDIHTHQLECACRSGVCIGNWVEADAAQEQAAQAAPARFTATTTVQDNYRPEVCVPPISPGTWRHTLCLCLRRSTMTAQCWLMQ